MIRIRFSKRSLRWGGGTIALLLFLAGCYVLGSRATPRDAAGRPLLLSPSVYRAERYRHAVVGWVSRMEAVDQTLTNLLAEEEITDPARLYALGQQAEEAMDESAALARDVTFTPPPPALMGLAGRAQDAVEAYLAAAQATARWIGAPEPEARYAALERLRAARGLRVELERSVWLNGR